MLRKEHFQHITLLPLFGRDYVNDVGIALQDDLIDKFEQHLNSMEPSIKVTVEESNRRLAFLDTQIIHHGDSSLTTTVYGKEAHTDQ